MLFFKMQEQLENNGTVKKIENNMLCWEEIIVKIWGQR
jgi:hypothetical protein